MESPPDSVGSAEVRRKLDRWGDAQKTADIYDVWLGSQWGASDELGLKVLNCAPPPPTPPPSPPPPLRYVPDSLQHVFEEFETVA